MSLSGSSRSTRGPQRSGAFGEPAARAGEVLGRSGLALLALFLVALVQATLLARVRFVGASPNLPLVTGVALSLLVGPEQGVLWGFAGGLCLDLISGMPLGTSSLALMTASLVSTMGRNRVFASNVWWPALFVVPATAVAGWVVLLTLQLRGIPVDWLASSGRVIGPEVLLNIVLMALVYPLLRRFASPAR